MQIGVFSWFLTAILLFLTVIVTIDFFMAWDEKKAASRAKRGGRRPGTAAPVSKLDTKAGTDHRQTGPSAATGAEGPRRDAGLDLMGAPRPTFRVTLPVDGKVLHLRMPTKSVADRFADIGDRMERFAAGAQTEDDVDALCDFAAVLLTNCTENQSGADFPVSAVKNRMTLDDVVIFVTAYMEWMTEVLTSKN